MMVDVDAREGSERRVVVAVKYGKVGRSRA